MSEQRRTEVRRSETKRQPPDPSRAAPPDEERAAVLNLLRATRIGARTVQRLLDLFDSAVMTLAADDSTLENVGGLTLDTIRDLREALGEGFGEKELEKAERLGVRLLLPGDDEYPDELRRIHNFPAALYVLGRPLPGDGKSVAVVGSRRAGEAGKEIAHQIGAGLSRAGVAVVSGMAYGIDASAHRGSLQESGHTIAVLGSGVDVVYPQRHRDLYDKIVRYGTVVSELFLGAGPEPRNFPMRNRIIAGLAAGTVVVEAAARSGSLITAAYALQENRHVFAVPGHPLARNYEGCNYLLRQGATLVRHAGDLLEDLAPQLGLTLGPDRQERLELGNELDGLGEEERRVVETLDPVDELHADKLADLLKIDASRLGAMLMLLEMKGIVQRLPGDHYRRRSRKV